MKSFALLSELEFLYGPLSRNTGNALQQQLYNRIKNAVLEGKLKPGNKLPGTRRMGEILGVSRNTIIIVYELLAAEGFMVSDNTGTRIVDTHSESRNVQAEIRQNACKTVEITQQTLDSAFFPGVPALNVFPHSEWRRAENRAARKTGFTILNYSLPGGEPALKEALASWLATSRGVHCVPEQIILSSGLHKTLQMCLKPITRKGDLVWVENPGYEFAKSPFRHAGLNIMPVNVDREGMNPTPKMWQQSPPRLIYLTPSSQYPTGATLSLKRRIDIINNAIQHNTIVIEDDYGNDFPRDRARIISMQGINNRATVIYIGSFSQMMFPALRIGFAVLPLSLLSRVNESLQVMPHGGNRLSQLTLAEFINSGRFIRHLNKMDRIYQGKRKKLIQAIKKRLQCPYEIAKRQSGTQLTLNLPEEINDVWLARQAQRHGISMIPLSHFRADATTPTNGLLIGYANTPTDLYEPYISKINELIAAQIQ